MIAINWYFGALAWWCENAPSQLIIAFEIFNMVLHALCAGSVFLMLLWKTKRICFILRNCSSRPFCFRQKERVFCTGKIMRPFSVTHPNVAHVYSCRTYRTPHIRRKSEHFVVLIWLFYFAITRCSVHTQFSQFPQCFSIAFSSVYSVCMQVEERQMCLTTCCRTNL